MAKVDPRLIKHLGRRIAHVTAATNQPSIERRGLLSAADLAGGQDIALRRTRAVVGDATLNHQLPIANHLSAAAKALNGITPVEWAKSLDRRIFLCPEKQAEGFRKSFDIPTFTLWLDTESFLALYAQSVDLSPINSGAFKRRPSPRGHWLYVPETAPFDTFRFNRASRGKRSPDSVKELSCRSPISAEQLESCKAS